MSGYVERLRAAQAAGAFPAGALLNVDVEHGPSCRHHTSRSAPCTCHPRITAIVGDQVLVIGTEGAILERSVRA